ncbi:MAG: hypothetical protein KF760_19530 [Candidatus Eremiobacteraeota bacterium]|nr:hypothetical protein [Candidatus Eremiobacteraeota bacterium]MCW5868763.1 hypothetical protein [Candidatus Eremiobacteraeota bacterium]
MTNRRGLTLLESLVSLSLFLMVMVLMHNLMNAAAAAEKFLGQKDRLQEVAVSCLYRMAYEARQATEWLEPASGNAALLRFRMPDWQQESSEFPTPTPSPTPTNFPSAWVEDAPAHRVTVEYAIQGGQLVRSLRAGSESWATPLLRNCQELQASRSGGLVRLTLTILVEGKPRENSLQFSLPQEAWKTR